MKTTAQYAIVGGGVIGLLTAYYLSKTQERILVIDASAMGAEASWAGGGIVSPLYPWRYPKAVTALASFSQNTYQALTRELGDKTGIDCEYLRSGLLIGSLNDREEAVAWSQLENKAFRLVESVNVEIKPQQIPWLDFPDIAQVRNPRLISALIARLRQMPSVVLIENEQVLSTRNTDDEGQVVLDTVRNRYRANKAVICAGAWSRQLAKIDVSPVRGQMIMFAPFAHQLQQIVLIDGKYIIPRKDGRVIVGSTLEHAGYDRGTTSQGKRDLLKAAFQMMPKLKYQKVEKHWAGLRPASPQGIPFISPLPESENIFINAGHFRNGVVLAPASAQLASNMLLEEPPIVNPTPYAVDRSGAQEAELARTLELSH